MDVAEEEGSSGPSSLSSDQASLCVIPDPDDSTEEDDFEYLDKSSLPESLHVSEQDRAVIVFHSVDEEYRADRSIVCEYIRPDKWQESWKDAIYLFKVGWVTHRDFICAVPVPEPNNDPIGRVLLAEHLLPKDTTNLYQFCYLRDFTVLGASTPFQFTLPDVKRCEIESKKSVPQAGANEENNQAQNLSCSCRTSFSESDSDKVRVEPAQIFPEGKADVSPQGCDNISLKSDACSSDDFIKAPTKKKFYVSYWDKSIKEYDDSDSFCTSRDPPKDSTCQDKDIIQLQLKEESSHYKQRFEEALEEKKWLQEQYNSLLITVKKYAEDLASVRSEKESLDGRNAELTISHKMLCSENSRLNNELETMKHLLQEQTKKDMLLPDIKALQEQLGAASRTNGYLTEEVVHLQTQIKLQSEREPAQQQCYCEKYMRNNGTSSDYEVIRKTLEAELQEELKLSAEREKYVAQLEKTKLSNLENNFTHLSGLQNTTGNTDKIREMEDNMNSTLEALECCMKEMEVLRSRKAAINRTNRTLREEYMKKQEYWKERERKQKSECDARFNELQEQLEDERSSKHAMQKELDALKEKLNHQVALAVSQSWNQHKNAAGALEEAQRKIESLRMERTDLDRECMLLREKMEKDVNITLLKNLEEAREEYKKLYTEKIKIQEKLSRLQQKVKTKKSSRSNHDTSEVDSAKTEFLKSVSSSWRAIVDELM
ncbi:rootletin-like isoform X2 [Thrips palmi]|uniref:Rootletin-like isoform X2 n=1 Tax=Thrips palmi TaxID=161013 RepID=A0A6P8YPD9_THRPL|nr:rootletin-like isoform X2 [Thrips palmi]